MGWILIHDGCCLQWVEVEPYILKGSYITENSTFNPLEDPYEAYINEQNPDLFYVKENYNMAEPIPHKHSQDAVLPSFDKLVTINVLGYDADNNLDNFELTPAQLIQVVAPQLRRTITVGVAGNRVDIPDLPTIVGIGASPQYLGIDDIEQDADGFQTNEGTSWDEGKKLTLFF